MRVIVQYFILNGVCPQRRLSSLSVLCPHFGGVLMVVLVGRLQGHGTDVAFLRPLRCQWQWTLANALYSSLPLQPWHHVWFCGQPPGKDHDQKDRESDREQFQRLANIPEWNPKGKILQPACSMALGVGHSESLCTFGSSAKPFKKPVNPYRRVLPFNAEDEETQPESSSQKHSFHSVRIYLAYFASIILFGHNKITAHIKVSHNFKSLTVGICFWFCLVFCVILSFWWCS